MSFHQRESDRTLPSILRASSSPLVRRQSRAATQDRDESSWRRMSPPPCAVLSLRLRLDRLTLAELHDCRADVLDLLLRDGWEHWQRQNAPGKRLRSREVARLVAEVGVRLLL